MAHMTKGHLASLLMAALRKQPAALEGAGREAAAEGLSTPARGQRSGLGGGTAPDTFPDLVHVTSTSLFEVPETEAFQSDATEMKWLRPSSPAQYSRGTEAKWNILCLTIPL